MQPKSCRCSPLCGSLPETRVESIVGYQMDFVKFWTASEPRRKLRTGPTCQGLRPRLALTSALLHEGARVPEAPCSSSARRITRSSSRFGHLKMTPMSPNRVHEDL